MRVCFFGTYERNYPRNQTLLKTMQAAQIEVIECHAPLWDSEEHKTGEFKSIWKMIRRIVKILITNLQLMWRYLFIQNHDLVLIGFPGHLDVLAVKWLTFLRRKRIVFDAFISLYDTIVNDRKLISEKSLFAALIREIDQTACKFANKIILDTRQHIDYFSHNFQIPEKRFARLWIGADDTLFQPSAPKRRDQFYRVVFCGKFTPFHGVDVILGAAKILETERDITFDLVGTGQLYYEMQAKVKELNMANVRLRGWMDYAQVPSLLQESDLCLGVFGTSEKRNRVIPNKIFEALAVKKPVVTGRAKAVEELLTDMDSIYFVTPGDAGELAHAIITLKNDPKLADKIAEKGYQIYQQNANLNCLSRDLSAILKSALN